MDGEDIGLAFLGVFALGGGYLAINELNRRKLGEKVEGHTHDIENLLHKNGYSEEDVLALEESHSHPSLESQVRTDAWNRTRMSMDAHLATENLTNEYPAQVRYAAMRNNDFYGRLVVGHPKGVWDKRLRRSTKSEGIVPAYRATGMRTFLPAMIPDNSQSDYFYNRINKPGSPDYDFPKYHVFSNNPDEVDLVENSAHRGSWITMVDLARALEALNGKVEEYRNAMYNDMREYGHLHPYDPGYEEVVVQ